MVEFGSNKFNQQYTGTNVSKPNAPVPKQQGVSDAQVKKETPKDKGDSYIAATTSDSQAKKQPPKLLFNGITDEQAEALAEAGINIFSASRDVITKDGNPKEFKKINDYFRANSDKYNQTQEFLQETFPSYKNQILSGYDLIKVYDDADGFVYVAGQGMVPFSKDGVKYPTESEVKEIADKALEGYLMVATSGGVDEMKNALEAKGELTEDDKQKLADLLKQQAKDMTPQEIRKYQNLLGAAYTNLIPGLDTHDAAKRSIENSEDLLEGFVPADEIYDIDVQNRFAAGLVEGDVLFAAPAGKPDEALGKFRQIVGGANIETLTVDEASKKADALKKEFNLEYA